METIIETNGIYIKDDTGNIIAEIDFPATDSNTVDINHTFVDSSLRGQNMASKLVAQAVDTIRQSGRKATVTCSYARLWFERHPKEVQDILSDDPIDLR
jgi:predicted GNAT family acetyltransferase